MPDEDRSPRSSLCPSSSLLESSLTKYIQLAFTLALMVPAMSLTHWLYVSIHSPPPINFRKHPLKSLAPVACFFISHSVLVVIFHDDHPPPISVVADASCHSVAGYDVLASISRLLDHYNLVCFHFPRLLLSLCFRGSASPSERFRQYR